MEDALYFIGIIPPKDLHEKITSFKTLAKDRFDSQRALNSPPHITLTPPFQWDKDDPSDIESVISEICSSTNTFKLMLKDFNCFAPRVIFVNVVENTPLKLLRNAFNEKTHMHLGIIRDYKPFRPHMTIAFKDLKKEVFYKAWDFFKSKRFETIFKIENIALLRFENEKWDIISEFRLQEEPIAEEISYLSENVS